jgi:hypothetical protein
MIINFESIPIDILFIIFESLNLNELYTISLTSKFLNETINEFRNTEMMKNRRKRNIDFYILTLGKYCMNFSHDNLCIQTLKNLKKHYKVKEILKAKQFNLKTSEIEDINIFELSVQTDIYKLKKIYNFFNINICEYNNRWVRKLSDKLPYEANVNIIYDEDNSRMMFRNNWVTGVRDKIVWLTDLSRYEYYENQYSIIQFNNSVIYIDFNQIIALNYRIKNISDSIKIYQQHHDFIIILTFFDNKLTNLFLVKTMELVNEFYYYQEENNILINYRNEWIILNYRNNSVLCTNSTWSFDEETLKTQVNIYKLFFDDQLKLEKKCLEQKEMIPDLMTPTFPLSFKF